MKKFVFLVIFGIAGAAAYKEYAAPKPSALETFLAYHDMVAAGRSFDEDAAFYTEARRAEVQSQIDGHEDGEALKDAYLSMTQIQASCSELSLAEDTATETDARLVFDVTDTCGTYDEGTKVQEIIDLTKVGDAWKIVSNETSVSN